jgi:hypothetical protein
MNSSLLEQARELASREAGLAVVVTQRPDGTAQASVVNAGLILHPLTQELAVGFVVQGGARKKLANLRARPVATVVFRSGWEWVSIEGDVDLVGPDDRLEGVRPESVDAVFHEIYAAAIGGTPDDWAARDGEIQRERHAAVLVRPARVYSNPPVDGAETSTDV